MKCRDCEHRNIVDFGERNDALCCGNKDNGERCGRIVDIFPKGRTECITNQDAPLWCVLVRGAETL